MVVGVAVREGQTGPSNRYSQALPSLPEQNCRTGNLHKRATAADTGLGDRRPELSAEMTEQSPLDAGVAVAGLTASHCRQAERVTQCALRVPKTTGRQRIVCAAEVLPARHSGCS